MSKGEIFDEKKGLCRLRSPTRQYCRAAGGRLGHKLPSAMALFLRLKLRRLEPGPKVAELAALPTCEESGDSPAFESEGGPVELTIFCSRPSAVSALNLVAHFASLDCTQA